MVSVDEVVVAKVKGSDVATVVTQIMEAVEERHLGFDKPRYSSSSGSYGRTMSQWFSFADAEGNRYGMLAQLEDGGSGVVLIEAKPDVIAKLRLTDICKGLGYELAGQKPEAKG